MYILLVYDINEKRVGKALKICRSYLSWVQNSVFEGEITEGKLKELQANLRKIIETEVDSILFYKFAQQKAFNKEVLGQERNPTSQFI